MPGLFGLVFVKPSGPVPCPIHEIDQRIEDSRQLFLACTDCRQEFEAYWPKHANIIDVSMVEAVRVYVRRKQKQAEDVAALSAMIEVKP